MLAENEKLIDNPYVGDRMKAWTCKGCKLDLIEEKIIEITVGKVKHHRHNSLLCIPRKKTRKLSYKDERKLSLRSEGNRRRRKPREE